MAYLNHTFEPVINQVLMAILNCPQAPANKGLKDIFRLVKKHDSAGGREFDCGRISFEHSFTEKPFKVSCINHWVNLCQLAIKLGYDFEKEVCKKIKIPETHVLSSYSSSNAKDIAKKLSVEFMQNDDMDSLFSNYLLYPELFKILKPVVKNFSGGLVLGLVDNSGVIAYKNQLGGAGCKYYSTGDKAYQYSKNETNARKETAKLIDNSAKEIDFMRYFAHFDVVEAKQFLEDNDVSENWQDKLTALSNIGKVKPLNISKEKPSAKNVMKRAWEIAKQGAAKFGGSSKLYFKLALKQAWCEVKNGN